MGLRGVGSVELVDLPHEGSVGQTWEKVVRVLIAPEPHKSLSWILPRPQTVG